MFEEHVFVGDLAYEYLAREASRAPYPHFPDWAACSPLIGRAYSGFVTPFPMFVSTLLCFLRFTHRPLPGMILHHPPHIPRRHCPCNHPPHGTGDDHLHNRAAAKAHPRLTTPEESGPAACVRTSFTISTNVTDISGAWESEQFVSPVGKLSVVGRTIGNDTTLNTARG